MWELIKKEFLVIVRDAKRQYSIMIYAMVGSILLSLTMFEIERDLALGLLSFLGFLTVTTGLSAIVILDQKVQNTRILLQHNIPPEKIFGAKLLVGSFFISLFRISQVLTIYILFDLNNLFNTLFIVSLSSFVVVALGLTLFSFAEKFEHGDLVIPAILGPLLLPTFLAELALLREFNTSWAIFLVFSAILYSILGIEILRRDQK